MLEVIPPSTLTLGFLRQKAHGASTFIFIYFIYIFIFKTVKVYTVLKICFATYVALMQINLQQPPLLREVVSLYTCNHVGKFERSVRSLSHRDLHFVLHCGCLDQTALREIPE